MTPHGSENLENRFKFFVSSDPKINAIHHQIRTTCEALAILIDQYIDDSREKSLALTKIEEAMFWANAGAARQNGVPAPHLPPYTSNGL